MSAFANQRPNFDLPDVSQSVYGTNEPAKTIYGEAVTGGLVCDIVEEQVPSVIGLGTTNYNTYMVRYAVCDVKPGFTYRIEDVEIGGEWQSVSAVPWKAGDRTFGVNGTGADFGDKYRFYSPHDASSFKGHVEIVSGFRASDGRYGSIGYALRRGRMRQVAGERVVVGGSRVHYERRGQDGVSGQQGRVAECAFQGKGHADGKERRQSRGRIEAAFEERDGE